MKKILIIFSIFLFIPGLVSGEKIKLKLWNVPFKDVRNTAEKAERAIFDRFLQLHPEIEIVRTSGIALTGQDPQDSILMAIAGGTAPDVLYVNFRLSSTYIEEGFLYPLDEYYEKWAKKEDLSRIIHPKVWQIIKQKGIDRKEHIYAVPYGGLLYQALWYRKDLFREAGLDPNRGPRTWDEFYEYAQKLTILEKGQYGWMTHTGEPGYNFTNFLFQAGTEPIIQDKDGTWKAVYNNSAGIEALKFYHKLMRGKWYRNGKEYRGVAIRSTTIWNEWIQGKVGMIFGDVSQDVIFRVGENPDLVGIAPMPSGPSGFKGNMSNQTMFGINSAIKDKKVRDAAWEYIRFKGGDEAQRIKTEIFVNAGEGKFLNPIYLKRFGFLDVLAEVPKEWVKVNEESIANVYPEPYGKNCEMFYWELTPPLDKVSLYDEVDYKAELDKAAAHTNERLLGYIPSEVMNKRRRIVAYVALCLGIVIVFFFIRFLKIMMQTTSTGISATDGLPQKQIKAWIFMLPALLLILLWNYYPLIRGLVMAFQDYKIIGDSKFIYLDNFVQVLWNPLFWRSLLNTIIYVVLILGIGFFMPVILALLLNEIPKGTLFFRTIYYLPAMTSPVVILLLWKQFYAPSQAGLFNQILGIFHIPAQTWLNDPNLAMISIIIPLIWAGVGAGSIIYLAALKNVPEELYEAASIDGASILNKITKVTLPTLKVLLIINFVGAFIGAFRATEQILTMTGGGPLYATHVIGLEIFYNAFVHLKFGYSTALAWILGSLLIGFTVYQLKIIKEIRFTTVKK